MFVILRIRVLSNSRILEFSNSQILKLTLSNLVSRIFEKINGLTNRTRKIQTRNK